MSKYKYIERDPETCGGAWRIKGRRLRLGHLFVHLAEGVKVHQYAKEYEVPADWVSEAINDSLKLLESREVLDREYKTLKVRKGYLALKGTPDLAVAQILFGLRSASLDQLAIEYGCRPGDFDTAFDEIMTIFDGEFLK